MGKRSAVVELFLGDMGSMQRELRPSIQREDQLTMETKLEQIAVKAVNQLPKSLVREIRTPRSVGTGGGRPPPATRWEGEEKSSSLPRPSLSRMSVFVRTKLRPNLAGAFLPPNLMTMVYAASRSPPAVASNAVCAALTTSAYSVVHSKSAATGRSSVLPNSVKEYSTPSRPVVSTLRVTRPLFSRRRRH
jgi:hypothetical protein